MAADEKEKTALISSVGADERQSVLYDSMDSISSADEKINNEFLPDDELLEAAYARMMRMTDPHYLNAISMTELYQTAYQSRPPIIDGLLYSDAYILAGAPKIGKSFLVAQLAYHVSTGQPLWNYEVRQGTVLYLALEDDFQRIQGRMFQMYGVKDSANLFFATSANKMGSGLNEQLTSFIQEHSDTRLIVIDTMQKIRECGGDAYSYASDYEIISKLKEFADRHSICVLTVHHTRKQPAGDSFEMISGTTGLLGCADGAFLMKKELRTGTEVTIDVVGRDQQDQVLYLKKDTVTQIWSLTKATNAPTKAPPDPVLETIADLVSENNPLWTGTATELANTVRVDLAANALSKYLNIKSGKLMEDYQIRYERKATHTERRIILTYIGSGATAATVATVPDAPPF